MQMSEQQSTPQNNNQTTFQSQYQNPNLTLTQFLPQQDFKSKVAKIKKNASQFIKYCLRNKKIVHEMIDKAIGNDEFSTEYEKNLAMFSVQVLSGDIEQAEKIFIYPQSEQTKNHRVNNSEIEEQIQVVTDLKDDQIVDKYENLRYLFEHVRQPKEKISPVCMNYLIKILSNLVFSKVYYLYGFFASEKMHKIGQNFTQQGSSNQKQNQVGEIGKSSLQYLIEHVRNFPGVAELLAKIICQEGQTNQFLDLKKLIISQLLSQLQSQIILKQNPDQYQFILDFVSYVFSRNKFKSEENNQQLPKITQRFVDQDVVIFFRDTIIKSAQDTNIIISSCNTSGNITNRSERSFKNMKMIEQEHQEQIKILENVFENSLTYLRILIDRLNSEEEVDIYLSQSMQKTQPTMDFQVDEVLFEQTSLLKLMTLPIPVIYKSMNKMFYYQLLLKMTRNSKYTKNDPNKKLGLQQTSLVPVMAHLLKTFRREYKSNGLVKFYIQQLLSEAILPKISKLDTKQAMIVISAFNPSENLLAKYEDYRVFCQKILLMLQKKCQWFSQHFAKLGVELAKIKSNYKVKLGGNSGIFHNRKSNVRQFKFLYENGQEEQEKKEVSNGTRQDKCQDDYQSEEESEEKQEEMIIFRPRRDYQCLEKNQMIWGGLENQQEDQTTQQRNGSRLIGNDIIEEFRLVIGAGVVSNGKHNDRYKDEDQDQEQNQPKKHKKSDDLVLKMDSQGEEDENQVVKENMKEEISQPKC